LNGKPSCKYWDSYVGVLDAIYRRCAVAVLPDMMSATLLLIACCCEFSAVLIMS
jgi:hypothetical protein